MVNLQDVIPNELVTSSRQNLINEYIEKGTHRINTLSLDINGTEIINSSGQIDFSKLINVPLYALLSGASFTGNINALNLSGTNTGDQVGDGITITGTGTVTDPFVAVVPIDTNDKVKYDSSDPTAGYLADKVVAGDGISLSEGTGVNENKLVITNTSEGNTDHSALDNLAYADSGHTGFQPAGNYLTSETDPVFSASDAASITSTDITNLGNLSGTNTGDQVLPTRDSLGLDTDDTVTFANLSGTNTGDQTLPTRDSLGLDTDDTVTFANLSGTNTGDQNLSGLVPYTGATADVNIGNYDFMTGHRYYLNAVKNPFPAIYTNWNYCKKITIARPDADLTDFPLFISFSDACIGLNGLASGADIRFIDANGNTLPFERVMHSVTAGDARGQYFVKVPLISSSVDTFIYILYGNSAATDGEDRTNVWDDNFVSVYNFGGYAPNFTPSYPYPFSSWVTQFKRDSKGSNTIADSSGLITISGFGHFPYANLSQPKQCSLAGYASTSLSYWCWTKYPATNLPSSSNARTIEATYTGTAGAKLFSYGTNSSGQVLNLRSGEYDIGDGVNRTLGGTGNYAGLVYDGSVMRGTKDGVTFNSATIALNTTLGSWAYTGGDIAHPTTQTIQYGHISTIRISNVARSDAWIKFTKQNLTTVGNVVTFDSERSALSATDVWIGHDAGTLHFVYNSVNGATFDGLIWNFYYPIFATSLTLSGALVDSGNGTFSGTLQAGHLKDTTLTSGYITQATTGGQLANSTIVKSSSTWVFGNGASENIAANSITGNSLIINSLGANYLLRTNSGGYMVGDTNASFDSDSKKLKIFAPNAISNSNKFQVLGSERISDPSSAYGSINYFYPTSDPYNSVYPSVNYYAKPPEPTGAFTSSATYNTGGYVANGYTHSYRLYYYNSTGIGNIYSSTYLETSLQDDYSTYYYEVDLGWDSLPAGVSGVLIQKNDGDNGWVDWAHYTTSGYTSFVDYDDTSWSADFSFPDYSNYYQNGGVTHTYHQYASASVADRTFFSPNYVEGSVTTEASGAPQTPVGDISSLTLTPTYYTDGSSGAYEANAYSWSVDMKGHYNDGSNDWFSANVANLTFTDEGTNGATQDDATNLSMIEQYNSGSSWTSGTYFDATIYAYRTIQGVRIYSTGNNFSQLQLSSDYDGVGLSWDSASGAEGYVIYFTDGTNSGTVDVGQTNSWVFDYSPSGTDDVSNKTVSVRYSLNITWGDASNSTDEFIYVNSSSSFGENYLIVSYGYGIQALDSNSGWTSGTPSWSNPPGNYPNGYYASITVDTQSYWGRILKADSESGFNFDYYYDGSNPGDTKNIWTSGGASNPPSYTASGQTVTVDVYSKALLGATNIYSFNPSQGTVTDTYGDGTMFYISWSWSGGEGATGYRLILSGGSGQDTGTSSLYDFGDGWTGSTTVTPNETPIPFYINSDNIVGSDIVYSGSAGATAKLLTVVCEGTEYVIELKEKA